MDACYCYQPDRIVLAGTIGPDFVLIITKKHQKESSRVIRLATELNAGAGMSRKIQQMWCGF